MELHYQHLLSQVTALNDRYKKISEITGENFNVFRILNLESSEVRMHSAFIAELLNPNGSHGQKALFLSLFINHFCFRKNPIDVETCKVEVEKHAGFISKDGTEGGRIDIIISDKSGNTIIIENKIYAGDQKNQLVRYAAHAPNADILYLTLHGIEPSKESRGRLILDEHFKCISYKKDIIDWLELCRKEVAIMPIIRESLTQYINLIKHLTNQALNHAMSKELNAIILANLESSFKIADNLNNALDNELLPSFIKELEKEILDMGLSFEAHIDFKTRYNGIKVWRDNWKYVVIGFQFQNYYRDMVYGICADVDPAETPLPEILVAKLSPMSNKSLKRSDWWPLYDRMEAPYNDWKKYEAWKAIMDGSMKNVIKEKISYLLKITEGVEL